MSLLQMLVPTVHQSYMAASGRQSHDQQRMNLRSSKHLKFACIEHRTAEMICKWCWTTVRSLDALQLFSALGD